MMKAGLQNGDVGVMGDWRTRYQWWSDLTQIRRTEVSL